MPAIPELTFREFADRIDLEERRVPIEGTIETTLRCNLHCAHCYVNLPVGDRQARDQELSATRLLGLIDKIAEAGCLALTLTGGEPLVRPDFPAVYLHAIRRGLLITVFTNGTLLDDRIADLFDAHRPERVEVSLYGMTRETYERISGIPGSHAACVQGIRQLHARGIPFRLKTMAMTWNRREIPLMAAYARSLGVGFTWDGLLNPRLDGGVSRIGELQLPAEEILAVDLEDSGRARELHAFCVRTVRPGETVPSRTVYTCGAGRTAFAVDPSGRLHPCLLSRKAGVDLRSASFQEGWNEGFRAFRSRGWTRPRPCRSCSLISLCGSCPAAAELDHGDPEGLVVDSCRLAHLRAHAMLGEACGHRADASCCLSAVSPSGATISPFCAGSRSENGPSTCPSVSPAP